MTTDAERLARLRNHLADAPLRYEDGATPPSADDVERARSLVPKGFLADCRALLSYSLEDAAEEKLRQDIAAALTTAREQGEAKGRGALNYVANMTYCGADAEWHFKKGYDPQVVLDALSEDEK